MKEGAWINARTGLYYWINEHTLWLKHGENAKTIGLPDEVILRINAIPRDFNGEGRRSILLLAMNCGLIRFRGHGSYVTFEGVLPIEEIASASRAFMAFHLGPWMGIQINDLARGESWNGSHKDLCQLGHREGVSSHNRDQIFLPPFHLKLSIWRAP